MNEDEFKDIEDNISDLKEFDDLDDLNELDLDNNEESRNNNNDNNGFEKLSEEDKKKYFFKLGFKLNNKYNIVKNISINDLYIKAKEESISPNDYENFLIKEFNIQ